MLIDTAIRNAKPREKLYELAGGSGLYLLINPSGSRWWRLKYRVGGKEKLLSLGVYPEVLLKLVTHPWRAHEGACASHRTAVSAGRGDPARASLGDW